MHACASIKVPRFCLVGAVRLIMPPKKRSRKDAGLEKYEDEFTQYKSLADEQLRRALIDIGENPGPINSSNRYCYHFMPASSCSVIDRFTLVIKHYYNNYNLK